jgi:hypothetical protein
MGREIALISVDKPDAPPLSMPERFRLEIVYFMTPGDAPGAPKLGPNEYWIEPANVNRWLEEGCFSVVSPLDAESVAEIELTEDQERWLEWLKKYAISQVQIDRHEN